jgi:hypothetical protein
MLRLLTLDYWSPSAERKTCNHNWLWLLVAVTVYYKQWIRKSWTTLQSQIQAFFFFRFLVVSGHNIFVNRSRRNFILWAFLLKDTIWHTLLIHYTEFPANVTLTHAWTKLSKACIFSRRPTTASCAQEHSTALRHCIRAVCTAKHKEAKTALNNYKLDTCLQHTEVKKAHHCLVSPQLGRPAQNNSKLFTILHIPKSDQESTPSIGFGCREWVNFSKYMNSQLQNLQTSRTDLAK